MFSLESDEMTALWPNDSLTFTFYVTISNSIPNWASFKKNIFDLVFSLESDEITAFLLNESLTFTFYVIFSNSIPNWTTVVKEVFWFGV